MSKPECEVDPSLFMSRELQNTAQGIATELAGVAPLVDFALNGLKGRLLDHASTVTDPHPIDPELREQAVTIYNRGLRQLEDFANGTGSGDETFAKRDEHIARRFNAELRLRLELAKSTGHLMPVDATYASVPFRMLLDESGGGKYSFDDPDSRDRAEARLNEFPEWIDMAICNMWEGIRSGNTQSKLVMGRVAKRLEDLLQDKTVLTFMRPLVKSSTVDAFAAAWVKQILGGNSYYPLVTSGDYDKHLRLVCDVVMPAYEKLYKFIRGEYLPRCRDHSRLGMWALPNGEEEYTNRLRYHAYDPEATPESIVATIQAERDKTITAMHKMKAKLGRRNMPMKEFITELYGPRTPEPFKSPYEVMKMYKDYHDLIGQRMGRIFNRVPRAAFEMHVDPNSFGGPPSYSSPSADGRTPGRFNLPLGRFEEYSPFGALRITLHEGGTGHHQHFGRQHELDERTMPALLRYCTPSLFFTEGWAMYAETLAKDLGIPETPMQEARRLATQLHLLEMVRLDYGINAQGWSLDRARAEQQFDDDPADISRAVAWAGQSVAYLGGLMFNGWRAQAEAALGDAFDLSAVRDFHEVLLGDGAMSCELMQKRIDTWIDTRLAEML